MNRLVNVLVYFAFGFSPAIAFASQQGDASTGFRGLGGLAFLIAYLTRKCAIGGWLLYYYWAVYSGVFLAFVMNAVSFGNFNPSLWQDQTRYVITISETIISNGALLGTAVVSTVLLFEKCRSLAKLSLLKKFLLVSLVMSFVSLGLDFIYPPGELIGLDIVSLIGSAVWYFYIVRSQRVQHVFVLRDFRVWYAISHAAKQTVS